MDVKESLVKCNITLSSGRMSCGGVQSAGPISTLRVSLTQFKGPTPLVPNHAIGHEAESVLSAPF